MLGRLRPACTGPECNWLDASIKTADWAKASPGQSATRKHRIHSRRTMTASCGKTTYFSRIAGTRHAVGRNAAFGGAV